MLRRSVFAAWAVAFIGIAPAFAQGQRQGPTASNEIVAQPTAPVPDDGNIILKFGETARFYFRRPIKSMRVEDELVVKILPQTDHVVTITALSPGQRRIMMTSGDSEDMTLAAVVTVVTEPHAVRVFQQREINRITGERRQDSVSAIGGYVTLNCNETGCSEADSEGKAVAPR